MPNKAFLLASCRPAMNCFQSIACSLGLTNDPCNYLSANDSCDRMPASPMSHPTAFRPRPLLTMQLHVGLAILFRGLANNSLAIRFVHALLLGLVCDCMLASPSICRILSLPMTHATACRPHHCVCCMAAHRLSMLLRYIARSALFCFSLMRTPTAFLQCNSHVSRAGASFFCACYLTPLSLGNLHRLLWVTYMFVLACTGFFLFCWCFFSKTTAGAAMFCCFVCL